MNNYIELCEAAVDQAKIGGDPQAGLVFAVLTLAAAVAGVAESIDDHAKTIDSALIFASNNIVLGS